MVIDQRYAVRTRVLIHFVRNSDHGLPARAVQSIARSSLAAIFVENCAFPSFVSFVFGKSCHHVVNCGYAFRFLSLNLLNNF